MNYLNLESRKNALIKLIASFFLTTVILLFNNDRLYQLDEKKSTITFLIKNQLLFPQNIEQYRYSFLQRFLRVFAMLQDDSNSKGMSKSIRSLLEKKMILFCCQYIERAYSNMV